MTRPPKGAEAGEPERAANGTTNTSVMLHCAALLAFGREKIFVNPDGFDTMKALFEKALLPADQRAGKTALEAFGSGKYLTTEAFKKFCEANLVEDK